MPGNVFASPALSVVLIVGRLVCASVEVWVLCAHLQGLLEEDYATRHPAVTPAHQH